jgi:Tfp pilus assembly protein PilW
VTAAARARGARGETLVELLVTVTIMGMVIVALVAGLSTTLIAGDAHRQESSAEGVVRNYAEWVADSNLVPYTDCASPGAYTSAASGFSPPAGWTVSVTGVAYLQAGHDYAAGCVPDLGAQQLTVRAVSPHAQHGADESVVVVKRRVALTGSDSESHDDESDDESDDDEEDA